MLSTDAIRTGGILLVTLVAVEFGGAYVLRLVRGSSPATPFQLSFARAGHAHAGILVLLGLVVQIFADASGLTGIAGRVARGAVPLAAILMPLGFFLSSAGRGRTEPSRLIWLLYAGAVALAAGVLTLGIGLLVTEGA